jgi:thiamine-monophosphate kinase
VSADLKNAHAPNLATLGEFGLIDRLSARCRAAYPPRVRCGIGDDCAVIALPHSDEVLLYTTDLLVERVHFLRDGITPRQLGHKALAVNLSDIAAMGGTPREALVSLAIPPGIALAFLDELWAGLMDLADHHHTSVVGGDTTSSKVDLVLSLTLTGVALANRVLLRSGALVGDTIFVSGPIGESGAGLDALLGGKAADWPALVRRHLEPQPHLGVGQWLGQSGLAHAMIDVSDGMAQDLGHICEQSGVGARLFADALPLSPELVRYARAAGRDPADFALFGGEDYVLLCTGAAELGPRAAAAGHTLVAIGEVTASGFCLRGPDGDVPLRQAGFDHLRGAPA